MTQIDKQDTHTIEVLYALIASLGAVGIVASVIALFIRSLACC